MRLTGVGFCLLQQPLPGQPISLFHADSGTRDLGGHNIEISSSRFQILCGFTKHRLEQQLGDGVSLDPCPLPGTHSTPQIWASRPEPVGKMTSRALPICQKRFNSVVAIECMDTRAPFKLTRPTRSNLVATELRALSLDLGRNESAFQVRKHFSNSGWYLTKHQF